jgi:hypothetical protein
MLPIQSEWDAIVVGAGVAGLTAAHDLNLRGSRVVVVDRAERCGGSHMSRQIGPYTFDVGSIFFTWRHPFFDMFPDLRPLCKEVKRVERRLALDSQIRHYPFNFREVLGWPIGAQLASVFDLARHRLAGSSRRSAEDICMFWIGRFAYERTGLKTYMTRFNGVSPQEIEPAFFEKRMGQVMAGSRLSSILPRVSRKIRPRGKKPQPLLVRPREGFDRLYDTVRNDLTRRGVTFLMGHALSGISREEGGLAVTLCGHRLSAPIVVGAVPLDVLHRAAFGEGVGNGNVNLLTLFVSVNSFAENAGNVLYNFHPEGRWKRATVYSRIYGLADGREYFAAELPFRDGEAPQADQEFEAMKAHMQDMTLVGADMRLEGHSFTEAAYPLMKLGSGDLARAAIARLNELGITPVGRQGRFDYLPTSIQVVAKTRASMDEAGLINASDRVK